MKTLKIILGCLAILILLLFIVPFFIPKSAYLNFVINRLEDRYPIDITVADASLSLLPQPTVTLKNTTLTIQGDSSETPFLVSEKFHVASNWTSLFSKIAPLSLEVENAQMQIREIQPGLFNFSSLITPTKSNRHKGAWQIYPEHLEISNSAVALTSWQSSPKTYQIDSFELTDLAQKSGQFSANVDFTGRLPQNPQLLSLKARPLYDSIGKLVSVRNANFALGDLSANVTGSADFSKPQAFYDLQAKMRDVPLEKLIALSQSRKSSLLNQIDGDLDADLVARGSLAALVGNAHITSSNFSLTSPGQIEIKNENLDTRFDFVRSDQQIKLSHGVLNLGPQNANFSGTLLSKNTQVSAVFNPLNVNYLKSILVSAKKWPEISGTALVINYSNGAVSGRFTAKKVNLGDNTLTNTSANFSYQNKVLRLTSIQGQTMGGSLSGDVIVNQRLDKPSFDFNVFLQKIDLQQIPSLKKSIAGRGQLTLDGTSSGLAEAWKRTLNGNGKIQTENIYIPKLHIFDELVNNDAWNLLKVIPSGINFDKLAKLKTWDAKIRDLQSQFVIKNGLIEIPQVNLEFPSALLSVTGEIGLDKTVNLHGKLNLDESLIKEITTNPKLQQALLGQGKTLSVPLTITGAINAPKVSLDGQFLASQFKQAALFYAREAVQTDVVKTAADDIKKKIEEKLPLPQKQPDNKEDEKRLPTASEIFETIEERIQKSP